MPDGLFDRPELAPKRARLLELLRTRSLAKREVILSSGTVNTARLLQISGVGPAGLLGELGVPVVASSVGGMAVRLRDHALLTARRDAGMMADAFERVARGPEAAKPLAG